MDAIRMWRNDTLGEAAVKALKKNGFDAVYVRTGAEAADLVAKHFKKGASVGFGGSMTVKAIGVQGRAAAAGCELLDHNAPGLAPEAKG
nr:LUD domain-containing protein [Spirochaetales bacterium]